MPLYEYQCDSCGRRFEVIQKLSDALIETCSACGGPVHKLQSAPAFQFKGTGWYVTDYARKEQPGGTTQADADSKEGAKATTDKGEKTEKGEKTAKSEKGADGGKVSSSSDSSSSSATTSTSATKT
ncbi:MAG: transcriptional regulator [Blastocatellia bacterium]|nr:MAG: transcriptional regulator [Blastocatellia bacterium]